MPVGRLTIWNGQICQPQSDQFLFFTGRLRRIGYIRFAVACRRRGPRAPPSASALERAKWRNHTGLHAVQRAWSGCISRGSSVIAAPAAPHVCIRLAWAAVSKHQWRCWPSRPRSVRRAPNAIRRVNAVLELGRSHARMSACSCRGEQSRLEATRMFIMTLASEARTSGYPKPRRGQLALGSTTPIARARRRVRLGLRTIVRSAG